MLSSRKENRYYLNTKSRLFQNGGQYTNNRYGFTSRRRRLVFYGIVLRFQGNSDLTAQDISIVPAGKSLKNLKRAGGKRSLLRVCLLVKNSLRYRFKFELRFHEIFRPDRASLFFRRAGAVLNCGKSENPSKEDRGARAANRA